MQGLNKLAQSCAKILQSLGIHAICRSRFLRLSPKPKGDSQLNSLTPTARSTILLAGVLIFGCTAIALSINIRTHSQRPNVPAKTRKDALRDSVESSPNL